MKLKTGKTKKLLDWSKRSIQDRDRIIRFYNAEASLLVAYEADKAIKTAGENVRKSPFLYREGKRTGTREYTMRRFPFTLIYRVAANGVSVVRVLHQAAKYFN